MRLLYVVSRCRCSTILITCGGSRKQRYPPPTKIIAGDRSAKPRTLTCMLPFLGLHYVLQLEGPRGFNCIIPSRSIWVRKKSRHHHTNDQVVRHTNLWQKTWEKLPACLYQIRVQILLFDGSEVWSGRSCSPQIPPPLLRSSTS